MKHKNRYRLFLLTLIGIMLFSCQKEDKILLNDSLSSKEELTNNQIGNIILGKRLENPYSVKNMRKAFENLKKKNRYKSVIKSGNGIEATDYYVKFKIENDEQRNLLIADSLNLSIIPLDYEIIQEGDYYIDENFISEQSQWLYTSVPKDYQFRPEIQYEIIEELFLIDDPNKGGKNKALPFKSNFSRQFLLDLEDEALRITNNYTKPEDDNISLKRSKRTPSGYIKVRNTNTGQLDPVIGVKVKTRRWFKWAKGWTNSQGYYRVNRGYRRDVHYTIVFKNTKGFKVWPSIVSISSARYRAGKHSKYGYSINFETNSIGWRWSTVNNATIKYLNYCSQFGIGKPHSNLRIVSRSGSAGSSTPMLRRVWGLYGFTTNSKLATFLLKANGISLGLNALAIVTKFVQPDIIINVNQKQTDRVFETTFHELGHASHFKKVGSSYWIKYINYIITYGSYGDGHGNNSGYCGVGEMWGYYIGARLAEQEFNDDSFYRFAPIDNWIPARINRRVVEEAGYTPSDIYSCLNSNVNSISKLKTEYNSRIGKNIATVNQIFNDYGY